MIFCMIVSKYLQEYLQKIKLLSSKNTKKFTKMNNQKILLSKGYLAIVN